MIVFENKIKGDFGFEFLNGYNTAYRIYNIWTIQNEFSLGIREK
jgi:hypothetical protein